MASFYEGWSSHDIIGTLNRAEVKAALLDQKLLTLDFRTWNSIDKMIQSSSDMVKTILHESAMAKKDVEDQHRASVLKRRREARAMVRNVRRRLGW